jgi:hypothetical protein
MGGDDGGVGRGLLDAHTTSTKHRRVVLPCLAAQP